nr:MAG TPA: hypothetical protein [Caudoviricetes sp.]
MDFCLKFKVKNPKISHNGLLLYRNFANFFSPLISKLPNPNLMVGSIYGSSVNY